MAYYECRHFQIGELVDRKTMELFGERAWALFNPQALRALDGLRYFFGRPITVNNWLWGGAFDDRGFRSRFNEVGADYSQHRLGNAFDCDVEGLTAKVVRKAILADPDHPLLEGITCIEDGVDWLHFDCRNTPQRIMVFKP